MLALETLRAQFPALHHRRDGQMPLFLDGPGGTQVPRAVIDAMSRYLSVCNANHGGAFATSRESDAVLDEARLAVADLLNAPSPDEIVFGQNMTSLTFHLSRSLGRTWKPGDEIVVTRMDHDANVSPWVLAARDAGVTVRNVDVRPEDVTLDLDDLKRHLCAKTKLVAVGCASNLVGTVNDVKAIARSAHEVGALVFLDAVHYAPHGPIDVQDWDCDFLACSAYKFFGPHVGILWGRRQLLEGLTPYKVRPCADTIPDRWMTGTQNHEGIAGVAAAIQYLAEVAPGSGSRRERIRASMTAIRAYESDLGRRMLEEFAERPRFRLWGIRRPERLQERVPTFAITSDRHTPQQLAEGLAAKQIYAWAGNMYALELTERLGLEDSGGILRLGLVHYNTADEIGRLMEVLDSI